MKIARDQELKEVETSIADYNVALASAEDNSTTYWEVTEKLAELEHSRFLLTSGAADDMVIIHVYYKELGVVQYQRDELYSFVDFIGKPTIRNIKEKIFWTDSD